MENALFASNFDTKIKQQLWDTYVNKQKNFKSIKHFKASVSSFYNHEDEKQCELFVKDFFNDVEVVFDTAHRDYAEAFFLNLSPTFLCNP